MSNRVKTLAAIEREMIQIQARRIAAGNTEAPDAVALYRLAVHKVTGIHYDLDVAGNVVGAIEWQR